MASNPAAAPRLFDRDLLRARLQRAQRLGSATFLLDRAAEDMADRLNAVLRDFKSVAEVGTPGDQVAKALSGRFDRYVRADLPAPAERHCRMMRCPLSLAAIMPVR